MTTLPEQADVLFESNQGVLTITLNDPGSGNLVDAAMSAAIVRAIQTMDGDVKAICLRGAGDDFCAGRKSPTPPKGGAVPSAEKLRHLVAEPALTLYDTIKQVPVPTLAVVQGRALGVGAALACVCDIAIAEDQARFSIPELERDIPPVLVMSALHDRVPLKTLAMMVYTREEISAADAQNNGLISLAVPAAALEPTVERWLSRLAATGSVALRACKQYMTHAPSMPGSSASAFASHLAGTALSARY